MTERKKGREGEDETGGGTKGEIRKRALRERRALSRVVIRVRSDAIAARVLSLPEFVNSSVIAIYVAKDDEVQTRPIIEASISSGKVVAVPLTGLDHPAFSRVESLGDMLPGRFGVHEPREGKVVPVNLRDVDLFIIPVVAWDERCNRLGYGGGYFDRALSGLEAAKVGLAFESQRFDSLPAERLDVSLDAIVTEERVVRWLEEEDGFDA